MAGNIPYIALAPQIALPWMVWPMFNAAPPLGMALILPILALTVLELSPGQRGPTSSLQAFTQPMASAPGGDAPCPMSNEGAVGLSS